MRLSLFLLALPLVACAEKRAAVTAAVERDSAGVHIVENGAVAPATWTVDSTPVMDIGGGADSTALVQVVAAFPLSGGRVVVLDAGAFRLRFYDSTGSYLGTAGRQGAGPGEFQAPAWMRAAGDRLYVYDFAQRRLSVLDSAGTFLRAATFGTAATGTASIPVDRLDDGRYVLNNTEFKFPFPGAEGEVRRDSATLVVVDTAGMVQDTTGRFPAAETFGLSVQIGANRMMIPSQVPFGRVLALAASGNMIYVGTSDRWEIRSYRPDGTLVSILRMQQPVRLLTSADIDRFKAWRSGQPVPAAMKPFADAIRASWEKAPYPKMITPYRSLMAGADGNIWVQATPITDMDGLRWTVFDSAGRLTANVSTPAGFHPTWIGRDRLLGIWQDPDEVQHVREYALKH